MKDINSYLNKTATCNCGRSHSAAVKEILTAPGALRELPRLVEKYAPEKKLLIVSDVNTFAAAGQQATAILLGAGVSVSNYTFPDRALVPDERAVAALRDAAKGFGFLLAVGSGTINDLARFVSHEMGIDYIVVATAPSMDGYASMVAPLIVEDLKTTFACHAPLCIVGDLDVLCAAPQAMIAAGVGDILGKYVCLLDWKLSALVTGEYHCSYVDSIAREALKSVAETPPQKIADREPEAVKTVMDALSLTGIAMAYAGDSRPASGSEHHLSHYWEMLFLRRHKPAVFHGAKVGAAIVLCAALYLDLINELIDWVGAKATIADFSEQDWRADIERAYGPAAPGVFKLEQTTHKNSVEKVVERLVALEANWTALCAFVEAELPAPEAIASYLKAVGGPVRPAEFGVEPADVADAVRFAKELRNRYGLLQMLFDLGLRDAYAERAAEREEDDV